MTCSHCGAPITEADISCQYCGCGNPNYEVDSKVEIDFVEVDPTKKVFSARAEIPMMIRGAMDKDKYFEFVRRCLVEQLVSKILSDDTSYMENVEFDIEGRNAIYTIKIALCDQMTASMSGSASTSAGYVHNYYSCKRW